ncbi:hypothetical protein BV25DRAFT_1842984 [Artomyces pyxidatus]|uniref:Uncharacterized protein n=1 Tax=Artomyces pyxidatus TaxID=48021 RepID=A0ACB8SGM8_9AGAM|nr:hypothetical protein BV25DRAFT_1842984 [Artomyces pyxidatus]
MSLSFKKVHTNTLHKILSHVRPSRASATTGDHSQPRDRASTETRDDSDHTLITRPFPPTSTMHDSGFVTFPPGSPGRNNTRLRSAEPLVQLPESLRSEESARAALTLFRTVLEEQVNRRRRALQYHGRMERDSEAWHQQLESLEVDFARAQALVDAVRFHLKKHGFDNVVAQEDADPWRMERGEESIDDEDEDELEGHGECEGEGEDDLASRVYVLLTVGRPRVPSILFPFFSRISALHACILISYSSDGLARFGHVLEALDMLLGSPNLARARE